jgi:hypothetical protein
MHGVLLLRAIGVTLGWAVHLHCPKRAVGVTLTATTGASGS